MGHLIGLFDLPWLGIRPNQRITMLHYLNMQGLDVLDRVGRRNAVQPVAGLTGTSE